MARTIAAIKKDITDRFINEPVIQTAYGLQPGNSFEDEFSNVSIESILFDVFAVAAWSLENILDIAIAAQNMFIKNQKIHSFTWYAAYAKKFQFGSALPWGEVEYDNSALTDAQVLAQQVVKYCICTKTPGGIMVKIAGVDSNNDLQPISAQEQTSFEDYMFRISAAGDNLFYTNNTADSLKATIDVYYDALVLNSLGERLDGTNNTPVADAVDEFLKQLDFVGRKFVPQDFVDHLQKIEGVKVVNPTSLQTQYGATAYSPVPADGVEPDAGYLRIVNPSTDLIVNYIIWT